MTHHAEAETLAAFMEGTLEREELDTVTAHLAECEECRALIGEAAMFEQQEKGVSRRWWMGVAAAVGVVVLLAPVPLVRQRWHDRELQAETQKLFASVPPQKRLFGRLTGQNVWRENRTNRGAENADLQLLAAAAAVEAIAGTDESPQALRARAAALAYVKQTSAALDLLERIPPNERDAATWNDIAVLRMELGKPDAHAAAERALQSNPEMPEALFNRATALRLENDPRAIVAYERYLKADPTGEWAKDARVQIARIKEAQ